MKVFLFLMMITAGISGAFAQQRVSAVLDKIEQNNTSLQAIKAETDAQMIGNRTGLLPSNPEVEFNYLWGTPSAIGNRTDVALVQSFDFPKAYAYRSQLATMKNEQLELEYLKQRNALFHQVRMVLAELTYLNALAAEYSKRVDYAAQMAENYRSRFNAGDANILELNKANVSRLNSEKELERILIERRAVQSELERLNGGVAIAYADSSFEAGPLITDFDRWLEQMANQNPVLQWLTQQIAISQKQTQLNKALRLPSFHAGYMSEKVVGEQFQGITAGVSIPLWENKNSVKHARAQTEAAISREADFRFQFYNEMQIQHQKALSLQASAAGYQENLQDYSNRELLEKALEAGEISLSEYLLELAIYYDSVDNLLEMKRDALMAYYTLYRYTGQK